MRNLEFLDTLPSDISIVNSEKELLCNVEDRQPFEYPALPQTVGACTIGSIAQINSKQSHTGSMSETTGSLS